MCVGVFFTQMQLWVIIIAWNSYSFKLCPLDVEEDNFGVFCFLFLKCHCCQKKVLVSGGKNRVGQGTGISLFFI